MTVEFVVMLPVILAIASVALYALSYLNVCLVFDRALCEAVCMSVEASYADERATEFIKEEIIQTLEETPKLSVRRENVNVTYETSNIGHVHYRASLLLEPETFPFCGVQVLSFMVPRLTHSYDVIALRPRNAVIL